MNVIEYITEQLGEPAHIVAGNSDWSWDEWKWSRGMTRLTVTQNTKHSPFVIQIHTVGGIRSTSLDDTMESARLVVEWTKLCKETCDDR